MFRIECFCDDKRLGEILQALKGLAYDVTPVPVANVKKVKGHARAANGSTVETLMSGIAKRKLKQIAAADAKSIMAEAGFRPGGYSNALSQARELGLLKVIPAANTKYIRYKVTGRKAPKGAAR